MSLSTHCPRGHGRLLLSWGELLCLMCSYNPPSVVDKQVQLVHREHKRHDCAALIATDGAYHANPRCDHIKGRRRGTGTTVTSERMAGMTRVACHACWRPYGYVTSPEARADAEVKEKEERG